MSVDSEVSERFFGHLGVALSVLALSRVGCLRVVRPVVDVVAE